MPHTPTRDSAAASSAHDRLLAAVIEHFSRQGLGDQSLRQIAAAVGSSHRMLLYHFGSKEALLVEVARAVEVRTMSQFEALAARSGEDTDVVARAMWDLVADPSQADFERLFFALYGRALQGEEVGRALLADNIAAWIAADVAQGAALGIPEAITAVHARLGLAVTRGLLLDLLATGDRAGVDAALEVFARRYAGRWWESDGVVGAESQSVGASDRAS
jgi:AcrR family transcriptional regulator